VNPNTQTKEFLAPRSGRIYVTIKCALCGLDKRCSCRAPAGLHGAAPSDSLPSPGDSAG